MGEERSLCVLRLLPIVWDGLEYKGCWGVEKRGSKGLIVCYCSLRRRGSYKLGVSWSMKGLTNGWTNLGGSFGVTCACLKSSGAQLCFPYPCCLFATKCRWICWGLLYSVLCLWSNESLLIIHCLVRLSYFSSHRGLVILKMTCVFWGMPGKQFGTFLMRSKPRMS